MKHFRPITSYKNDFENRSLLETQHRFLQPEVDCKLRSKGSWSFSRATITEKAVLRVFPELKKVSGGKEPFQGANLPPVQQPSQTTPAVLPGGHDFDKKRPLNTQQHLINYISQHPGANRTGIEKYFKAQTAPPMTKTINKELRSLIASKTLHQTTGGNFFIIQAKTSYNGNQRSHQIVEILRNAGQQMEENFLANAAGLTRDKLLRWLNDGGMKRCDIQKSYSSDNKVYYSLRPPTTPITATSSLLQFTDQENAADEENNDIKPLKRVAPEIGLPPEKKLKKSSPSAYDSGDQNPQSDITTESIDDDHNMVSSTTPAKKVAPHTYKNTILRIISKYPAGAYWQDIDTNLISQIGKTLHSVRSFFNDMLQTQTIEQRKDGRYYLTNNSKIERIATIGTHVQKAQNILKQGNLSKDRLRELMEMGTHAFNNWFKNVGKLYIQIDDYGRYYWAPIKQKTGFVYTIEKLIIEQGAGGYTQSELSQKLNISPNDLAELTPYLPSTIQYDPYIHTYYPSISAAKTASTASREEGANTSEDKG